MFIGREQHRSQFGTRFSYDHTDGRLLCSYVDKCFRSDVLPDSMAER